MIFVDSSKAHFDLANFENWDYEIPLFGTHPNFGIRDVLDGVPKKGSENASKAASKV